MGYKKKKNVMILTLCVVVCFILYQLYFFLTITGVASDNKTLLLTNHEEIKGLLHLRSEDDKYVSHTGILKGIRMSSIKFYRPDAKNEFKCRMSDQRIPFEQVNDDYCDCDDGTDEPSTNACPNGVFYCENQNQKKLIVQHVVPSSQVNDGICDCCDGSDEWLHKSDKRLVSQTDSRHNNHYVSNCPNICNKNV